MYQFLTIRKSIIITIILILTLTTFTAFGQNVPPTADSSTSDKKEQVKRLVIEAKNLTNGQSNAGYRKAIENMLEVLRLSREMKNTQDEALSLQNIGNLYNLLGEQRKSLDYFNQSVLILRELKNQEAEAQTLNNIGYVYEELGDLATALDYYNQAMTLYRAINKSKGKPENYGKNPLSFAGLNEREAEAQTLNNIGLIYAKQKEYQKALDYYELSLPLSRASGDLDGESAALNNIGSVYDDLKKYETALEYYNHALLIVQAMKNQSREAATLDNIGAIYEAVGNKPKALAYYNQALIIYRTLGNRRGEAVVLNNLMLFYNSQKNTPLAIFYGKQSVNKYQELRRAIKDLNREQQKNYLKTVEGTYQTLADILVADGRFKEAQAVLSLLKEQEYLEYTRGEGGSGGDDKKKSKDDANLRPDEKKLLDKYDELANHVSKIGDEFQTLDDKKRRLPDGENLSADEQTRYTALTTQLAEANAAFKLFLEQEIVAELGKTVKKEIDIDRSLQEKLRQWGNGTVALYTIAGEDRYRVILTTPTVQVDGKTEVKAANLNKKIFAFREALQNPSIDPRPLGKEIYDILIKPIEKDLQAAKAKTLIWSLDGTLRYIPLAALSPDGKTYLVEKYQSVVITSATRQSLLAENEKDWRTLGLGVSTAQTVSDPILPDEKISFSALPGVKKELSTIVKDEQKPNEKGLLAGKRLIDADFNLANFGDSLTKENTDGKRKYTIVHIASHFRLGDDSTNSFLLLGGGNTLTLEQISNSPSMQFGDVELVTLSACNTAFDSNDATGKEVDSLATFIELRGAKAIIATLWAVADESTQLLMGEFYRLHKENPNITKAEAMQSAQREMINGKLKSGKKTEAEKRDIGVVKINKENMQKDFKTDENAPFAHPYFWSPFVLIGNWR